MTGKVTTLAFGMPPSTGSMLSYNGHLLHSKRDPTGFPRLDLDRCSCCPYGYHIDRDFVPFSKSMLSTREANEEKLQELRAKLRSQRNCMDRLLGVPGSSSENWKFNTLSKASVDVWKLRNMMEGEVTPDNSQLDDLYTSRYTRRGRGSSSHSRNQSAGGEEVVCLDAAVQDFETCLTKTEPGQSLTYNVGNSSSFHTLPRLHSASSSKTSLGAVGLQTLFKNAKDSSEPQSLPVTQSETPHQTLETKGIQCEMNSAEPTQNQRTGALELFNRIQELEQQLKLIPELQVKVTLLTEEKRQVMKLLDTEKRKRSSLEEVVQRLSNDGVNQKNLDLGDCNLPIELEARKPTQLTRDVASSPVMFLTRSIGVGDEFGTDRALSLSSYRRCESYSPTGSLASTKRRRVKTFDVSVQVLESDLGIIKRDPLLEIKEQVDAAVQVFIDTSDKENVVPLVAPCKTTKHIGVSAKPRTLDAGFTVKPSTRDYGVNPNVISVRSVATGTTFAPNKEVDRSSIFKSNDLNASSTDIKNNNIQSAEEHFNFATAESSLLQLDLKKPAQEVCSFTDAVDEQISAPSSGTVSPASHVTAELNKSSRIPRLRPLSGSSSPKSASAPCSPKSLSSPKFSVAPAENATSSSPRNSSRTSDSSDEENASSLLPDNSFTNESEPKGINRTESDKAAEPKHPSKELQGALKVLNDALLRGRTTKQVTAAISIILREWFQVSGTKTASPQDIENYLDAFEGYSPQLLRYVVNMPDGNGNTAMHYAVSHGNFDVVSVLLDSKTCDPNKANKAGYTCVMLVSLAKLLSETHRQVVRRLLSIGDVNVKAAQHGQTALMLAASHGRLDTVRLLIEAGADANIRDEDGSTALMCSAEHGHGDIVKYFLTQGDCDPHITDNDGSTALNVAMEAGHKDIGVMLYAHMNFVTPTQSPTSSKAPKKAGSPLNNLNTSSKSTSSSSVSNGKKFSRNS